MHVVVVFGSANETYCDLNYCPMEAFGPFENSTDAVKFAEKLPDWQRPHILRLGEVEIKSNT